MGKITITVFNGKEKHYENCRCEVRKNERDKLVVINESDETVAVFRCDWWVCIETSDPNTIELNQNRLLNTRLSFNKSKEG